MYDTEYVNVLGTLKLLEKLKYNHFIYISSIFSLLDNDSEFYNIYSLSKKHSEELASLYCGKYSKNLTILRPSSIYGEESLFSKHQPFFYEIINKVKRNEDISLYGSNDPQRNYIHIDDLLNIIKRVIVTKTYGCFDCGNPEDTSYSVIAKLSALILKTDVNIKFDTSKPDIPNNVFYKNEILYQKIKYKFEVTYKEGLRRIIEKDDK